MEILEYRKINWLLQELLMMILVDAIENHICSLANLADEKHPSKVRKIDPLLLIGRIYLYKLSLHEPIECYAICGIKERICNCIK